MNLWPDQREWNEKDFKLRHCKMCHKRKMQSLCFHFCHRRIGVGRQQKEDSSCSFGMSII